MIPLFTRFIGNQILNSRAQTSTMEVSFLPEMKYHQRGLVDRSEARAIFDAKSLLAGVGARSPGR